jgi:ABC-type dipeptide/oligopeptide/nickel transport system permease subunit
LLFTLLGPWLAPHDYASQYSDTGLSPEGAPLGPSAAFPLGTDHLGRDVLSRLMYGAWVSMAVGFVATAISLVIGVSFGLLAGYFRGWVDTLLMRFTDVMLSFPFLLLCIVIVKLRGEPGIGNVFLVLGLLGWTSMARVVRSKVLSLREMEFVTAARALGAGHLRILLRHILPNILGPVIVLATLNIAVSILSESVLSYLGLGVPAPAPSWGQMLSDGQAFYRIAPRLIFAPGALILLTVLGFNLLGEGLRDVLDPKNHKA